MKVLIYISKFNAIGGVEAFVISFCKRLGPFVDLKLIYDAADDYEIFYSLQPFCCVEKINRRVVYNCDVFVNATAWGYNCFSQINAKKYVQMIHADYAYYIAGWKFNYKKDKKTTHHVAVSNHVKSAFELTTKLKIDRVIYNLTDNQKQPIPKPKNKILTLVTVSRISKEKGFERMLQMAEKIPVPFVWNVYGNAGTDYAGTVLHRFPKSMIFNGITKTPEIEISKADYLVQLSDTEGNCYAITEALQMRTPVICTPFPSAFEQIENGINGYFVPFEIDEMPWDDIINRVPIVENYVEKSTEADWLKLFYEG